MGGRNSTMYGDIVEVVKDHYRDHQLTVVYCSQAKASTKLSRKSL
jgi:hypothetical protein